MKLTFKTNQDNRKLLEPTGEGWDDAHEKDQYRVKPTNRVLVEFAQSNECRQGVNEEGAEKTPYEHVVPDRENKYKWKMMSIV